MPAWLNTPKFFGRGGLGTCLSALPGWGHSECILKSLHLEAFLHMPNFMHLSSSREFNGPTYTCEVTCVQVSGGPGPSTKLLCFEV